MSLKSPEKFPKVPRGTFFFGGVPVRRFCTVYLPLLLFSIRGKHQSSKITSKFVNIPDICHFIYQNTFIKAKSHFFLLKKNIFLVRPDLNAGTEYLTISLCFSITSKIQLSFRKHFFSKKCDFSIYLELVQVPRGSPAVPQSGFTV